MPKFGRNYSVGDSNIHFNNSTKNVKLTNLEPVNETSSSNYNNNNETPILSTLHRQSEPIFSTFKDLRIHRKSIQTQLFLNSKDGNRVKRRSIACPKSEPIEESEWMALIQLIIPFLIAGFGNVAAGIILDNVQFWEVFVEIPQLMILVPALLGLKGNVEMTLASRLSTHANMGHMDIASELKSIVIGNLSLVQCQASTMGLIAPLVAIAISFITKDADNSSISFEEVVLVTASSLITANIANLLLATLMSVVVIFSRKFSINPDNIATPIAEAFGDVVTLLLLAYVSQALFNVLHNLSWLSPLFLAALLLVTPVWGFFAYRSDYTKKVLISGWLPILGGMVIQNMGGLIMEHALGQYERMASFQPVINGVGGNLAAIQSSRISTHLHKMQLRQLDSNQKLCVSPVSVFFGKNPYSLMAKLLLLIALPGQLIFIAAIYLIRRNFDFTLLLAVFYLSCAIIQVAIVLILCFYMVQYFWRRNIDPDSTVIPFLTAFADLLGSALLLLAFFLLHSLNDPNAKMIDEQKFVNVLVVSNITRLS